MVAAATVAVPAVNDGRLSGVALAVVVLTPLAAFEAVTGLPLAVQYRQRVARSAERVFEVLDAPVPVREPETPAEEPASPFPLEVRGLSARYPGARHDALASLDLTLTPGRRIAVVGPSGSGKTTLAQVLLRFLDASSGTYRLGGVEASALDSDTVRRSVGLCAQDAHVFDSSIRENLRLARPGATDAELRDALSRARLLDWVLALPEELDTPVGEHGARLSGGQRQRLALARALLADFPVLVLDELGRTPRPADRRRPHRRPAGRDPGLCDGTDHPPADRPRHGRRGAGAGRGQGRAARTVRRTRRRGRAAAPHAGA